MSWIISAAYFNRWQSQADIVSLVIQTEASEWFTVLLKVTCQTLTRFSKSDSAKHLKPWPPLRHMGAISVFCHHKRSLANGTSGMRHRDNTKHLFSTLRSGYVITAVHNRIKNKKKKTWTVAAAIGGRTCSEYLNWFLPRDGPNWRNWL